MTDVARRVSRPDRKAVETPDGIGDFLPKRRALLLLMQHLLAAQVPAEAMAKAIRRAKFLPVDGELSGEELRTTFTAAYSRAEAHLGRWFLDEPIHDDGRTWILSKMWGSNTIAVMDEPHRAGPGRRHSVRHGQLRLDGSGDGVLQELFLHVGRSLTVAHSSE